MWSRCAVVSLSFSALAALEQSAKVVIIFAHWPDVVVLNSECAGAARRYESAPARRARDSLDGLLLAHLVRVRVRIRGRVSVWFLSAW